MGIYGVSMADSLARLASDHAQNQLQYDLAMTMLRKIMDQSKAEASAMLSLSKPTAGTASVQMNALAPQLVTSAAGDAALPSPDGLGQFLDIAI